MASILGIGAYLPDNALTNDDLATFVDTSDEWIATRTGIRSRHIAKDETTLDMAEKAARAAIANAGIQPSDIALVVLTTVTAEQLTPPVACALAGRLGISCAAFDLGAACCGFLYGAKAASGMIRPGEKALVVSSEKMSRLIDWTDRSTCVLFGDGAGAAVIGDEGGHKIDDILLRCVPDTKSALVVDGVNTEDDGEYVRSRIHMNGQEVYKFATRTLAADIRTVLDGAGLAPEDVAYFVPHQANQRIIESSAKQLGLSMDKFFLNIQHTGNTSSASCIIALTELMEKGMLKDGDKIVMAAFGGGFTSNAALITW